MKRNAPIQKDKIRCEGAPSEIKVVLGWEINTRAFTIHLPVYKHITWSKDLQLILKEKATDYKSIKTLVGRLTHTATMFFPGRFFLNRLRSLERRCEKYDHQKLSVEELRDLNLWSELLDHITTTGVSINNITFTSFDNGCISDVCEHGLGAYTSDGLAFRYHIPPHLQGLFSINLLEFVTARWAIHLAISSISNKFPTIAHIGDNTSVISLLRKTSFDMTTQSVHNAAARKFAESMMEKQFTLTTLHKAGKKNIIADILSRDTNLSFTQLNFIFNALTDTITSELSYLKQLLPNPKASPQPITRSNMGNFLAGHASWTESESAIRSWMESPCPNRTNCFVDSPKVLDEINLANQNEPFCEF